uniref:Uncharacterized protein n=1 Tax=Manihot esculenta TaxID=3983 RepID=A0A2C9W9Z8_MANES
MNLETLKDWSHKEVSPTSGSKEGDDKEKKVRPSFSKPLRSAAFNGGELRTVDLPSSHSRAN